MDHTLQKYSLFTKNGPKSGLIVMILSNVEIVAEKKHAGSQIC